MKLRLTIILILLTILNGLSQPSPFNHKEPVVDSTGNYSFIVSGHFYGDGTNKSHYPANTLLGNLNWINSSGSSMLVCLGDLFMDVKNDIPFYRSSFFDQLDIPLYNAVGNHDLTDHIYQDNFGETYFAFSIANDLHIFLDSELDNGDIAGDQLNFLKAQQQKIEGGNYKNVFIYAHRTVWKDTYDELEGLFLDNTQSVVSPNYRNDILPLVKLMSEHSDVYWFAGSIGQAPASFFYFNDPENRITYIGTAIRTLPRDAMLLVNSNNGDVSFEPHSLTGEELMPLENYNVELWKNTVGAEPFNWRLVPLYVQQMFLHRYFWYGIIVALFGLMTFQFFRKKRKAGS